MIDKLKTDCLQRWGETDQTLEVFSNRFSDWMDQFPDTLTPLIGELLSNFEYYPKRKINNYNAQFFEELMDKVDFSRKKVIFTPLKFRKDHPDSSTQFSMEFMLENEISWRYWCQSSDQLKNRIANADIIVVIDDTCGSGDTIIKFFNKYSDKLIMKHVVYMVYHFMEEARARVIDEAHTIGFKLDIITHEYFEKGFSKVLTTPSLADDKIRFCEFSKEAGIKDDFVLGYKMVESLVAFCHDTPNTTLGIFWFNQPCLPIFPGKEEKQKCNQLEKMQSERKKRKQMNYDAKQEYINPE